MKPAILCRVALLLICLGPGLFGRLEADGFPLPLQNAGTWGKSPAELAAGIQRALKNSGFLDAVEVAGEVAKGIGQGKVPAIDDLKGVTEGDVERRVQSAVAQATDATQLLGMLDVTALQQLFATLQNTVTTPQEFAFTIPGGRLVFRRSLVDVSLYAVVAGPGGARVTLGMSNGQQLCGNPAGRFLNPTREPVLFTDLAVGLAHVQARRKLLAPPVPGPDPALSIQAAVYFKIHEEWVELRLAGNDPQSLTLKLQFVVGVKAGFSVKIQAEVEGQVILELGVKPTQVASLLHDIGDILKRRLGNLSPASAGAAPALAASTFQEVFQYLRTVEDRGEELGELALRFAGDGGVGVGIWDTGINAASVGAELTLSVPLEAVVSLQGDLLATQFETGLEISTRLVSFFEAMSEGRLTEAELQRQLGLVGRTADEFARAMLASYADYLQDIELRYEMGVNALGDIGQVADQTIPLIQVGADIPVGKILVNGVNGIPRFVQGVTETTKAMVWTAQMAISAGLDSADRLSLGRIVKPPVNPGGYVQRPRGNPPTPPTPAQWEAMAASLLDDVMFSIQLGVIEVDGASLGNLVRLAGGANEVTTHLLVGAIQSALQANEKPLLDALRAAPNQIGNEARDLLIFNLQNLSIGVQGSLGASGTIGAEATAGVGASIGFEARIKASLILLALGSDAYGEEDGTLLAGIDFPVEASVSAGVSVGEGVEFSAEGGVTTGTSLANLTLKDWGQDLPVPAGLRIAGFEALDFEGKTYQDGITEGKGWLVLPMGGLVRVDSAILDAEGQVLDGQWSGVIELGPLGTQTIAGGAITENGLIGSFNLQVGSSTLATHFRLHRSGLLFGTASGSLDFGGFRLANVGLSLTDQGKFAGNADFTAGSVTHRGSLTLELSAQPFAELRSDSAINGLSTRLDLVLHPGGASGNATVNIFGQPVAFSVSNDSEGFLKGSTRASLATPWLYELSTDLTFDRMGIHGSGATRILGSRFVSNNLRIAPSGQVTGTFTGDLEVAGQVLVVPSLEILADQLRGRTRLNIAGRQAVEILLTVDGNGVTGTSVSDLDLFGTGSARAWLRITDRIEVFGEMNPAFFDVFAGPLRRQLLADISSLQATLRQQEGKISGIRADVASLEDQLAALEREIIAEKEAQKAATEKALEGAREAVEAAKGALNKAVSDLLLVSGQLSAELNDAETAFRVQSANLNAAKAEVNRINNSIAALDGWYARLDAVSKVALWLPYQASRGTLLASRDVALKALTVAQQIFNASSENLRRIREKLDQSAGELLREVDRKDALLTAAEDEFQRLSRELETILLNPRLDPRYVALSLTRDTALALLKAAEDLIAHSRQILGSAAGLIDFIAREGEDALVTIDRISFRAGVAELNSGTAELIVNARLAGQLKRLSVPYDFKTGQNDGNLAAAAETLSPQLYPETPWRISPWTNDASSGIAPGRTVWAYRFNSSALASLNAVPVIGVTGTSPAIDGRFSLQGFTAGFEGDENTLTSGGEGSSQLATHFLYGANPGTVTFLGLSPGVRYRATFLSVGWDDSPITRLLTFGSPDGSLIADQNAYGNNNGIRIDHDFTATAESHTVSITPASGTFHLYALALTVEVTPNSSWNTWAQSEFGADAFDPAVAGELADPDGDNIPNYLEYALRSNPQVKNASPFGLPVPVRLADGTEAWQLTIPYQPASDDVVYRIRNSNDLATWTDTFRLNLATGAITQLPGVTGTADPSRQTVTVTITDPSLIAPPSFWRLTAEKP